MSAWISAYFDTRLNIRKITDIRNESSVQPSI